VTNHTHARQLITYQLVNVLKRNTEKVQLLRPFTYKNGWL